MEQKTAIKSRARIIKIGTVENHSDGTATISGWDFDCKSVVPPYNITDDGLEMAGYTRELLELASRFSDN